jgi:hypothetical protein
MKKTIFYPMVLSVCLLSLLLSSQPAWAWQHIHHIQAAKISYNQIPAQCRRQFNLTSLMWGGIEPDKKKDRMNKLRKVLINPSHKNDTGRITASYGAALKVADSNRTMATQRIARSFHYILDQSEAEDNLRERLYRTTGLNSRALGLEVLMDIQKGANLYYRRHYPQMALNYSRLTWQGIEAEVRQIRKNMNQAVEKSLQYARSHTPRAQIRSYYQGALSYYLTSILALQNTVMYRFCNRQKTKTATPDRNKLRNCLCGCFCIGKNMGCSYNPKPVTASPACRDVKRGPCVAQGFGCTRFTLPPADWCRTPACKDCIQRCRQKYGG